MRDWRNGVPAPFLEYALSSNWMDTSAMQQEGKPMIYREE